MNITEHAKLRMSQRGIQHSIVDFAEFFLPTVYEKQSNKIFLSKKLLGRRQEESGNSQISWKNMQELNS